LNKSFFMYQTLLTNLENNILTITINRPDKLNALNKIVIEELALVINEIMTNKDIRSAIITGAGPKAFVAGADISEFIPLDAAGGKALAQKGQEMVFNKIENCPKPIIAAVNGFALGGGCELAMACHFRIASDNAKFGQPEVSLGLIPGYGGTQRLTYLIGKGRSLELLMSASMIDAQTALQYGLVNHVVPQDELLTKAKSILELINSKAPVAVAKCIECANVAVISDSAYTNGKSGFEKEIEAFGECFATEDMKEGVSAFLEKRKAAFKGK
jgi:enoyl-CoA hydratase